MLVVLTAVLELPFLGFGTRKRLLEYQVHQTFPLPISACPTLQPIKKALGSNLPL